MATNSATSSSEVGRSVPRPDCMKATNPFRRYVQAPTASTPNTAVTERRPIDKSLLAIPEVKRLRDKDHLSFVATHPCLVCGRQPAEAHHLKFSQPSALGRKVSDAFTVPLCALHHRDLHTTGNELAWWEGKKIDPLPAANDLWNKSHGREVKEDVKILDSTS